MKNNGKKRIIITDLSLLQEVINGNLNAYEELINRYKKHSRYLAIKALETFYGNIGVEVDDLISVGLLAFLACIKRFSFSKKISFYSFWRKVALNKMKEHIRSEGYLFGAKYFAGNVSLDDYSMEDSSVLNAEILGSDDIHILGDIDIPDKEESLSKIFDELSDIEQKIYLHMVSGQKPKTIARLLHIDTQKVYRIIRKIRQKISDIL